MIQTEALQIIQTVALFGSFATAARHLHKVPSAISYTVRKTEEQLGVQLFIRDSRRVKLTPAGEHFIQHSRPILDELKALSRTTRQAGVGHDIELHIVLDNIVNQGAVTALIRDFQAVFPETHLHIAKEIYIGGWDALYHNRCQLVIGAPVNIPAEIHGSSTFRWKKMGDLQWLLVMAPDHPLAQRQNTDPVQIRELFDHTTIVIEDSARVLRHGGDGLAGYGHRLVVPSFAQALHCAAAGVGVCMAPRHFAEHFLANGLLVSRPVPELAYNPECLLAWNHERMGSSLRWCLDWLGNKDKLSQEWLSYCPERFHLDMS